MVTRYQQGKWRYTKKDCRCFGLCNWWLARKIVKNECWKNPLPMVKWYYIKPILNHNFNSTNQFFVALFDFRHIFAKTHVKCYNSNIKNILKFRFSCAEWGNRLRVYVLAIADILTVIEIYSIIFIFVLWLISHIIIIRTNEWRNYNIRGLIPKNYQG